MPHIYENKYQCLNMIKIQCIGARAHTNINIVRNRMVIQAIIGHNVNHVEECE